MCHITRTFISVDTTKEMLGTFSPQLEPYTFDAPEETTPSGYFARGSYTAKSKVTMHDMKIMIVSKILICSG